MIHTFITKLIDDSLFVNAMATAFEDTKSIVLPDIVKDETDLQISRFFFQYFMNSHYDVSVVTSYESHREINSETPSL